MKKLTLGLIVGLGIAFAGSVFALSTFQVVQGGTGQTTLTASQLLYGIGTGPVQSTATTSVTCSGSVSCSTFNVLGSSPITLTGSGMTFSWPFTKQLSGSQATSTVMEWIGGFMSDASSTLTRFTAGNSTTTGTVIAGDIGGVYLSAAGSGVGGIGFNSTPDGSYNAGVTGYGALFQLAPSTGVFNMYTESNVIGGAPHGHIISLGWDATGLVSTPVGLVTKTLLATGSTTLQNFTATNSTSSNSTTTTFAISNIANGSLLKIAPGSGGGIIAAILGTDYINASEQNAKEAVKYATVAALPANNYTNGVSGVGATIIEIGVGALSVDGASPSIGDRILVKNEGTAANNGIYTVTVTGSGIAAFTLTRATDFNQSADIMTGDTVYVTNGTTLATTIWSYNGIDSPTMGSTSITFTQTGGPGAPGGTFAYPFFTSGTMQATSTTLGLYNGFLSTASSTHTASTTLADTLITNATTTNLFVSNLASTTNLRANSSIFGNITVGSCSGCGSSGLIPTIYMATTTGNGSRFKKLNLVAGDMVKWCAFNTGGATNQGTLDYKINSPGPMATTTVINLTSISDANSSMSPCFAFEATTTETVTFAYQTGGGSLPTLFEVEHYSGFGFANWFGP